MMLHPNPKCGPSRVAKKSVSSKVLGEVLVTLVNVWSCESAIEVGRTR